MASWENRTGMLSLSKESASRTSTEENKMQRVVLLAGPHKTSSSSIQLNIFHWLNGNSTQEDIAGLSKSWAWPSPSKEFIEHDCEMNDHLDSKIFYPFIESIKAQHKKSRCINSHYSLTELIKLYHDKIYMKWKQGYNLVIASEAIDFIASERRSDGPEILNRLVDELPWHERDGNPLHGSDEDITAVVGYRTPRVDHLISLWHQCCMQDMSLYEYVTHRFETVVDPLRSLDSLKLAKVFLDKDIETVIIDMSGVAALGFDMSNIVACDVLNAECTERKTFPRAPAKKAEIANIKTHSQDNVNMTSVQLDQINDVIERYDCNFVTLMQHKKVKILYSKDLDAILSKCKEREGDIRTRDDMVRRIIDIARGVINVGGENNSEKDDDYYSDDETDSNSGDTNESTSEVEDGFKVNGENYYEEEEEA